MTSDCALSNNKPSARCRIAEMTGNRQLATFSAAADVRCWDLPVGSSPSSRRPGPLAEVNLVDLLRNLDVITHFHLPAAIQIGLFDELSVTRASFAAPKPVLLARFPAAPALGFFIARPAIPNPIADVEDNANPILAIGDLSFLQQTTRSYASLTAGEIVGLNSPPLCADYLIAGPLPGTIRNSLISESHTASVDNCCSRIRVSVSDKICGIGGTGVPPAFFMAS